MLFQMFLTADYCFDALERPRRSRVPLRGLGATTPPASQHFPKDPRCLSSRARRSICLTAAPGCEETSVFGEKTGEAHVGELGGDTLGDAAAQINADALPVCAEWKLRNGVCVGADLFISFHSGCLHTKRLLSQIFLSISHPLLFPPSSPFPVCPRLFSCVF